MGLQLKTSPHGYSPNANVVAERGHYPFGEVWYETGQTDKWKFTSYERDAESDLDYAVHRYYSYRIGRFQTTEPCALTSSACSGATVSLRLFNPAQQSPAETNLYTYVVNNPLNRTDPEGLQWGCPWWDPWCGRGECHGYGRACWPGGGWGWAYFGFPVCREIRRKTPQWPGGSICPTGYKFIEEWECVGGAGCLPICLYVLRSKYTRECLAKADRVRCFGTIWPATSVFCHCCKKI